MTDSRKHSRIYHEVMDDPKFDGIREDVRHFGTWALLLVVADMAWPASAYMPPVPKRSVDELVERGLVETYSGGRYRIHGLDRERGKRSAQTAEAGRARASSALRVAGRFTSGSTSVRTSDSPATAGTPHQRHTSLVEKSREEQRKDEQDAPAPGLTDALTWLSHHGCLYLSPGSRLFVRLEGVLRRHPIADVLALWEKIAAQGVVGERNYIFAAEDALDARPDLRAIGAEERADEEERQRQRRVEANERQLAEYRHYVEPPEPAA